MDQINVEMLMKGTDKLVCAHCGKFTGTKCKYICRSCRRRMQIQGKSDIQRYYLIRYLLRLVKENAPEKTPL